MDGLTEALKTAGVANPELVAFDRDAVLRVLLEARLIEKSDTEGVPWRSVEFATTPHGQSRVKVPVWAVLDLLAPEAPRV